MNPDWEWCDFRQPMRRYAAAFVRRPEVASYCWGEGDGLGGALEG
jgi:hypothetical protein